MDGRQAELPLFYTVLIFIYALNTFLGAGMGGGGGAVILC